MSDDIQNYVRQQQYYKYYIRYLVHANAARRNLLSVV